MTYLLDTNVWVAILRKKNPEVAVRYGATSPAEIRVCSVVVAELRYGCLKSAKPAASRAVLDTLLAPIISLPFDDAASDHFATIRHHLESIGQKIGPYDAQIAAIALANGCTLRTTSRNSVAFPASWWRTGRTHEESHFRRGCFNGPRCA